LPNDRKDHKEKKRWLAGKKGFQYKQPFIYKGLKIPRKRSKVQPQFWNP